jgi:hypothetical protein
LLNDLHCEDEEGVRRKMRRAALKGGGEIRR